MRPFGTAHTGKRGGFISIPSSSWSRKSFPQFNDSNNPLAVELESETTLTAKFLCRASHDFTSIDAEIDAVVAATST